jgi:hypothetical protein
MMMAETGGDTYCDGGNTRIHRPRLRFQEAN